jgi:iron(III) transport system ATP-binding protein
MGEIVLGPIVLVLAHRGLAAGPVDVAIRPEAIAIGDNGAGLQGTIRKVAYLGGLMEYTIDTELGPLFAIDTAVDRPRAIGSSVGLRLADHGVVPIASGDAGE